MKTIKSLLVLIIGLTVMNVNSQNLTSKQLEKKSNKVEILTLEEQWDIQLIYFQEVEKMNLTEEEFNQYSSTLLMYTSKMMRLDDLDQDYTYQEIVKEMDTYLGKINTSVSTFLSKESYDQHLKIMDILHGYIKVKMQRPEYLQKLVSR